MYLRYNISILVDISMMATITRVNPTPDGLPGAFFGHQSPDIFEIDANISPVATGNLAYDNGPQGALAQILKVVNFQASIEWLGNVQTGNLLGNGGAVSTTNNLVRVITTGHGAWPNAATLQAAIRAVGTVNGGANLNLGNAMVYGPINF